MVDKPNKSQKVDLLTKTKPPTDISPHAGPHGEQFNGLGWYVGGGGTITRILHQATTSVVCDDKQQCRAVHFIASTSLLSLLTNT